MIIHSLGQCLSAIINESNDLMKPGTVEIQNDSQILEILKFVKQQKVLLYQILQQLLPFWLFPLFAISNWINSCIGKLFAFAECESYQLMSCFFLISLEIAIVNHYVIALFDGSMFIVLFGSFDCVFNMFCLLAKDFSRA